MLKKRELQLLWPFYLSRLIFGLSLVVVPFFVVYFRDLGYHSGIWDYYMSVDYALFY